jgi:hypothetical protein
VSLKTIWDYVSTGGRNEIESWVAPLSKRDQGALVQRLIQLRQSDRQTALDSRLIAGPLRGQGNLYKLKARGDCQLRPHLCTGPRRHESEYTMLAGAVEKGGKLIPEDVDVRAVKRRSELERNEASYARRAQRLGTTG